MTVPEIRPPCASAKFIPDVVAPVVTVIGVPDVGMHGAHVMLL